MKKFIVATLIAVVSFISVQSHAQIVKPITLSKTSLTNTDTSRAFLVADKALISVEVSDVKVSGTVAGSVKLQGSFDGVNWDDLNTLTLSDVALNRKVMALPTPLVHAVYRIIFISSGTNATTVSAKALRRTAQ